MAETRETAALIVRGYCSALADRDVLAKVREVAPPAVQKVLDQPPLPIGWVPSELMDAFFGAMGKVLTLAEVRAIGYTSVRDNIGPILRPILRGLLRVFGTTPASIFGHFDKVTAIMIRGMKFEWKSGGPTSGTMTLLSPAPMPDATYAGFEGAFLFAFDVCSVKGTVGESRVTQEGCRADVDISWT